MELSLGAWFFVQLHATHETGNLELLIRTCLGRMIGRGTFNYFGISSGCILDLVCRNEMYRLNNLCATCHRGHPAGNDIPVFGALSATTASAEGPKSADKAPEG